MSEQLPKMKTHPENKVLAEKKQNRHLRSSQKLFTTNELLENPARDYIKAFYLNMHGKSPHVMNTYRRAIGYFYGWVVTNQKGRLDAPGENHAPDASATHISLSCKGQTHHTKFDRDAWIWTPTK